MHDEVCVAADRRGEVCIAAQVQAEVAIVLRGVFRLRLRAQHDLVDQLLVLGAFHARKDLVEVARAQRLTLGQRDVECGKKFAQRLELLRRRLVVHAIDQRGSRALQRLGRRDVGEDHELLDQPVRIEARRNHDAIDRAVWFEQDLALGQIEIERLALRALALDRRVGRVERLDHRIEEGAGGLVRAPVGGLLRLRVMKLRGGAHQHAMESVACVSGRSPR